MWYSEYLRRRDEKRFGDAALLHTLTPGRSVTRPLVKFGIFCLALCACIIMLARPQFGQSTGTEQRKGIEAVIMLDVSQSMLAQDVTPNRLERAKLLISTLVHRMKDDKIALGVFAGEAYPQLPITNDYVSAQLFLDHISTDMIGVQGTDVAAAIQLARRSFTQEKGVGKAIIIITDGENHEGGAVEAAKDAAKAGMHVYMMGVGTQEGAIIPTPEGPLTDGSGDVVRTSLGVDMCKEIAEAGNGVYIHVDGSNLAQDQLKSALATLQHSDSTFQTDGAMDEQFQAAALLLFFLLLVELLTFGRQVPFYSRFNFFNASSNKAIVILMLAFASASISLNAQTPEYTMMHQGNRAFQRGEWSKAEQYYRKALEVNPRNGRAMFNLGDAYLAQKNGKDALECYAKAGKMETNRHVKAMAFHNIGFIHQNNKDYDRAIDAYKEALRNNPRDEDTRYNLALCQKQQKQQPPQDQPQDQPDQNNGQSQQNEKDKQPPQPDQQQMSEDNAEQLLNMARQAEQQTRQKLDKMRPPRSKQLPKNW